MLKPENRLGKVRDFNLILKSGRWANGSFCDLRYLELDKNIKLFPKKEDPKEFVEQLKVAFAVGLKISKSAVIRNRVKRQLREVVRLLIKENKIKHGQYLLFVVKKEIVSKEYLEIKNEVELLLKRAGLFI